jgi:hypothetical protein
MGLGAVGIGDMPVKETEPLFMPMFGSGLGGPLLEAVEGVGEKAII